MYQTQEKKKQAQATAGTLLRGPIEHVTVALKKIKNRIKSKPVKVSSEGSGLIHVERPLICTEPYRVN